jgi:hypothetical protein
MTAKMTAGALGALGAYLPRPPSLGGSRVVGRVIPAAVLPPQMLRGPDKGQAARMEAGPPAREAGPTLMAEVGPAVLKMKDGGPPRLPGGQEVGPPARGHSSLREGQRLGT